MVRQKASTACARCKRDTAIVGSRCMSCFVSQAAKRTDLCKQEWWQAIEPMFALWMVGRYLNDGLGTPPPSAEDELRSMRIIMKVRMSKQLDNVKAIIEKVDEARRKHADSVRRNEG